MKGFQTSEQKGSDKNNDFKYNNQLKSSQLAKSQTNPFDIITNQVQHEASQEKNHINKKFNFRTEDFRSTPIILSLNTDFDHLKNSELSRKNSPNNEQQNIPINDQQNNDQYTKKNYETAQKYLIQSTDDKYPDCDSTCHLQAYSKTNQQTHNQENINSGKFRNVFTDQVADSRHFMITDHNLPHPQTTGSLENFPIDPTQANSFIPIKYHQQNILNYTDNQNCTREAPLHLNHLNNRPHDNNSGNHKAQVKNSQLQRSMYSSLNHQQFLQNTFIIKAKTRLDEIMKKFPKTYLASPTNNPNVNKNNPNLNKNSPNLNKNSPSFNKKINSSFEMSAPQLQIRKSQSINDHEEENKLNFNGIKNEWNQNYQNAHTEGKILIHKAQYQMQQELSNFRSQIEKRMRESELKPGNSLNYSESNGQLKKIQLASPNVETLCQQIHDQEEEIATYKQIVYRLENQNIYLLKIIQQFQTYHQNTFQNDHDNNPQYHSSPTNLILPSKKQGNSQNSTQTLYHQRAETFNEDRVVEKTLQSEQQIHQFQRQQLSSQQQREQPKNQNNQKIQKNASQTQFRSSGKIRLPLQQQVEMLESEKTDLLNKIEWLNEVIEEMMTMGSKLKTEKSGIVLEHLQQSQKKGHKRPSRNPSCMEILANKQSKIIQTSQIDYPGQTFDQINYKRLYEKQVQHQQAMKQQIHELQSLQDLYSEQFMLILKEIAEIKRNREYYQQLRQQIKQEKQRNLSSKYKIKPAPHYSTHASIFQNQIIYQLKTQNQTLRIKYDFLKQLYAQQKAKTTNQSQQNFSNKKTFNHSIPQVISSLKSIAQHQNPFALESDFQNSKALRQNSMFSMVGSHSKRPASYGSFYQGRREQLDSYKQLKNSRNRQNGTITCLNNSQSSPVNYIIPTSQSYNFKSDKYQQHEYRNNSASHHNRRNQSLNSKIQHIYTNRTDRNRAGNQITSSKFQNHSLAFKILEKQKQKPSSSTNETNQKILSRYNNFIKNMKKRFGINSSIIGKEVATSGKQVPIPGKEVPTPEKYVSQTPSENQVNISHFD